MCEWGGVCVEAGVLGLFCWWVCRCKGVCMDGLVCEELFCKPCFEEGDEEHLQGMEEQEKVEEKNSKIAHWMMHFCK